MVQATVLIPTHDHGPTLLRAARSALAQTVTDIEVLIVGDGVPDVTREIVADLKADARVRFFDHPKGPRRGELYRHAILGRARGEIVCYLADDDLWLPDHVETMRRLLRDADFVHALPLLVEPGHGVRAWGRIDLADPAYRQKILSGYYVISLSCGAHTLEMYRRLPYGWRTTPDGIETDLYMWQQFLAQPECRAVSSTRPTALVLSSVPRRAWTTEKRVAELDVWAERIADPEFVYRVLDDVVRDYARSHLEYERLRLEHERLHQDRWAREADIERLLAEPKRLRQLKNLGRHAVPWLVPVYHRARRWLGRRSSA